MNTCIKHLEELLQVVNTVWQCITGVCHTYWRVSGEMLCGTVPHREVQVVIGSFPSSLEQRHNIISGKAIDID